MVLEDKIEPNPTWTWQTELVLPLYSKLAPFGFGFQQYGNSLKVLNDKFPTKPLGSVKTSHLYCPQRSFHCGWNEATKTIEAGEMLAESFP